MRNDDTFGGRRISPSRRRCLNPAAAFVPLVAAIDRFNVISVGIEYEGGVIARLT